MGREIEKGEGRESDEEEIQLNESEDVKGLCIETADTQVQNLHNGLERRHLNVKLRST